MIFGGTEDRRSDRNEINEFMFSGAQLSVTPCKRAMKILLFPAATTRENTRRGVWDGDS